MSEYDPLKDPVEWAKFQERMLIRFERKEEAPLTAAERLAAFHQRWPQRQVRSIPPQSPEQPNGALDEPSRPQPPSEPADAATLTLPQEAGEEATALEAASQEPASSPSRIAFRMLADGSVEEFVPDASRGRALRQMMVLMERPFFALSKRQTSRSEYISPDGTIEVSVEPGPEGMATIYDADVLMFLVDQLHSGAAGQRGALLFNPGAYFDAVGSKSGGDQYRLLGNAIERLRTTRVTTNARPNGKPGPSQTFCWLEGAKREGAHWQLTLPDWLVQGARSSSVLSISTRYFGLSGFERFLYLTARKHVGNARYKMFPIGMATLWKKSGSRSPKARFAYEMKRLAIQNALPEYSIQWKEQPRRDAQLVFSLK